ncbi:hypothetical protein Q6293_28765, partial [Klebsiella pneumoniae]|uniref:hypothetical protein n=1 Tax=Klebsiella pneumoniae TaxID=573 RepID=UPI00272F9B8D
LVKSIKLGQSGYVMLVENGWRGSLWKLACLRLHHLSVADTPRLRRPPEVFRGQTETTADSASCFSLTVRHRWVDLEANAQRIRR